MLRELKWDSDFFKKKIGELIVDPESPPKLSSILKKAKERRFQYIICKLHTQHIPFIKALESSGFYLSDVGVTWEFMLKDFNLPYINKRAYAKVSITTATGKDISMLKRLVTSLFRESRFYNDPFFSKREANRLYRAWIENSVKRKEADIVYIAPEVGFVTCKKVSANRGEIILIGIKKGFRGKGIGKTLLGAAFNWAKTHNLNSLRARTQLRNLIAMNFYAKSGFYIKDYDFVFAKIL